MQGFTLIDGAVAAVIVISAILAYSRGLVREVMAIVGWVAAAILAFVFAPSAQPLMQELPFIGDFLGNNCEIAVIAAFAAVFTLALVVVSLFTPLFSSLIRDTALGGVDRSLGFLFGAARGVLLVLVAFILYDRVLAGEPVAMIDGSRSAQIFAQSQAQLDQMVPTDAPGWIVQRYDELTSVCNG